MMMLKDDQLKISLNYVINLISIIVVVRYITRADIFAIFLTISIGL